MLADTPCWAFDYVARSIALRLRSRFEIQVKYAHLRPRLDRASIDLLYVFFWGETWPAQFPIAPQRVIKEVASYRWALEEQYGRLSPEEFVNRHLFDCNLVVTPSRRIYQLLAPLRYDVYWSPNGIEPSIFGSRQSRSGPLRVGWVGNPNDPCKGLMDIIIPACKDRFDLDYTDGSWSRFRVAQLYEHVDVLAIASTAESQPLPLIEAMACGCFPVATDVGIVPELVHSGYNGLVVDRSINSFRKAFEWCSQNLDYVRSLRAFNSHLIRDTRSWDKCAERFAELFDYALAKLDGPPSLQPDPLPEPANMLKNLMAVPDMCSFNRLRSLATEQPFPFERDFAPARRHEWQWRLADRLAKLRGEWAFLIRPRWLLHRFVSSSTRSRLRSLFDNVLELIIKGS